MGMGIRVRRGMGMRKRPRLGMNGNKIVNKAPGMREDRNKSKNGNGNKIGNEIE